MSRNTLTRPSKKRNSTAGISWRARLRTSACKQAFLTQQLRRLKLTILRQRVRRSRQRHFRGATTEITCPNSGPRPRGRTYMSNTKDRQGTRNPTLALLAISDINTQVSQLRPPDTQPVPRLPIHPPSTPPQPQIPSYRRLHPTKPSTPRTQPFISQLTTDNGNHSGAGGAHGDGAPLQAGIYDNWYHQHQLANRNVPLFQDIPRLAPYHNTYPIYLYSTRTVHSHHATILLPRPLPHRSRDLPLIGLRFALAVGHQSPSTKNCFQSNALQRTPPSQMHTPQASRDIV